MSDDTTSIDAIEHDLMRTRARLDATIGELQQKLSPGELMDQAMTYFKESGGMELGQKFGQSVRDNPIPVAMIGVGLGWLVVAGSRKPDPAPWENASRPTANGAGQVRPGYRPLPYAAGAGGVAAHQTMPYQAAAYDDLATKATEAGSRLQRRADETEDAFEERTQDAKAAVLGVTRQVGEAAQAFRQRVEAALASAKDQVRRTADQAQAMASEAGASAADFAGDVAHRGEAGLRHLYGYGQDAVSSVRDGADHALTQTRELGSRTATYLQQQPLLLGALGVALGAGLGMLLPSSRYEREIVRDVRRGLRDQAEETVRDAQFRVARVAETVIETAKDATRREGFTGVRPEEMASSAREQVADTASRARGVVEETVAAGRDALQREMSGKEAGETADGRGPYDQRRRVG